MKLTIFDISKISIPIREITESIFDYCEMQTGMFVSMIDEG
jgi:hypothetical protein